MIFLRIVIVFFIALFFTPFVNSYNSDDLKTFYINDPINWTSLFNVPEGKDFIIKEITSSDINEKISIRDTSTGASMVVINNKDIYNGEFIVIKDELQIISNPATAVDILVFGFVVSEDEDITNYIQGNSTAWTKHIFNKEDIDYIYFREFIIFFLLVMIKFLFMITGRKTNIF